MEETKNYKDYVFQKGQDVLVPVSTYMAMTNIIQEVEQKHSTRIRTDKYAFFDKATHEKLSDAKAGRMLPAKLEKDYYENIDMEGSQANVRVDRDELGSAAIQMLAEFKGIFTYNVDKGNATLREKTQPLTGPKIEQQVPTGVRTEEETKQE